VTHVYIVITPESRAFTAGYILSDVLIKNLTLRDVPCRYIQEEMTQFLNLAIAVCIVNH
jgi:hypothetical protein